MTKTSPLVTFGLYALTIKQDATPAVSVDLQPFSKLADIKTGNVASRPYATFEPDYWLLDGGYKFKQDNDASVHVGIMSLLQSDEVGAFAVPPVLTVTFSTVHTTDGMTFKGSQYSNDFANSIQVAFYDASDVLIRTDAYTPTSWEFSTGQAVTDFKKIVVTFNSTNKPYRYLRLPGIDFGKLTYFTGADIKSASVIEEFNPLSIELPIDTCELHLYSNDSTFSIINPSGDYSALQNKQPLDVYEVVGTEQVYIGQFYLDTWENVSNNEIIFRAIDMLGILETIPYMGGLWITPTTAGVLIEAMMSAINTPYDLDPDLSAASIQGWIPATTYREALQQIAFAIGAYVTCSRAGLLQIYTSVLASDLSAYDYTITKAEKGIDRSLTLKTLVTGVEVTAHNYLANTDSTELYNGYLALGTHTITFSEPKHTLSVSGAAITASGANYAVVNVTTAGTVVLSGLGYTDTKSVNGVYNTTLGATVSKNILSIKDATLVNPSNVAATTQRVYNYYQMRYLQKVKLYSTLASIGDSVLIDTLYNQKIGGVIEKMSINLSGGFTAQTEIVGGVA
jgi:hypothetical protein